jgi:hypothetical protein
MADNLYVEENTMNNVHGLLLGSFICLNLASCTNQDARMSMGYEVYPYENNSIYQVQEYKYNYYVSTDRQYKSVEVPNSYHVNSYQTPVSFKDRDRDWVNKQNPQGYTIEVADEVKAAEVAQKLYKAPNSDRRAQIKYQRNGKEYYKGVYGSFESQEAAQKALDALPPDVKQGAGVKKWGAVQSNASE